MGSINNLPKSADLMERFAGKINKPDAWTHGKRVSMTRHQAMCSKGYKSKYEHVLTAFITLRVEGEKTKCKQYSGKHLNKAIETFNLWKSDLMPYLIPES